MKSNILTPGLKQQTNTKSQTVLLSVIRGEPWMDELEFVSCEINIYSGLSWSRIHLQEHQQALRTQEGLSYQ